MLKDPGLIQYLLLFCISSSEYEFSLRTMRLHTNLSSFSYYIYLTYQANGSGL
jgi:hypothetical protein